MYVVIYRGAPRRRIRRLVRSRVFNNPRTATRNFDLPLAIGDPIATQLFLLHGRILASAWRPQQRAFLQRLPPAPIAQEAHPHAAGDTRQKAEAVMDR